MLIGAWLLVVGIPFAIWPAAVSRIADRLRLQQHTQISPRQARYARFAGVAIALVGGLIVVAIHVNGRR